MRYPRMVIFNSLVLSCGEKLRLLRQMLQMLQDRIQATSNNQPFLQYAVHSRRLCILNQIAISSIAVLSCMIVIVGLSIHFIIDGNEKTTNRPKRGTTTTTRSRRVSSLTIAPTIYIWCICRRFIPDLILIYMVPSYTMPITNSMNDLVLKVHLLWHVRQQRIYI